MTTIDLKVQNMSCGACVTHVKKALAPVTGISDVAVDLATGHVHVTGESVDNVAPIIAALTEAGYPAQLSSALAAGQAAPKTRNGGCCCS
jgi:copper chaperone